MLRLHVAKIYTDHQILMKTRNLDGLQAVHAPSRRSRAKLVIRPHK